MRAIKNAVDLMGDDAVELTTEDESLEKTGSYDEKKVRKICFKTFKTVQGQEKSNFKYVEN